MSSLAGLQSSSHGKNFNVSNFLDTLAHKGMDVKHMCSVFDSHEKNESIKEMISVGLASQVIV